VQIYNDTVTEQDADLPAPANTSEWQPPPAVAGAVYYQYNGAWVLGVDIRTAEVSTLSAASLLAAQSAFETAVSALTSGYTASERASWNQQVADATVVQAGGNASTLLTTLAEARGLAVTDLATKILAKNTAYQTSYAALLADLQKNRDAISNAKTVTDLPLLSIPYLVRAFSKTQG
jgi:hypothetical protein